MKYVILQTMGARLPFIFPDALVHADVALFMQALVEETMKVPKPEVKSAGFISLGVDVTCHGESESLGVKAGERDAMIICVGEQAAFPPEEMLDGVWAKMKEFKRDQDRSPVFVDEEDEVWLRDLDGTGSMHVCNKVDPGAERYIRAGERE